MRSLLTALLLLASTVPAIAAPLPASPPRELRVLFVGNSLTYVNNLPAMLRALAIAQPVPVQIHTTTFVAPGGTLIERWNDGHAADVLRAAQWDAVVLQERGGVPACLLDPMQRARRDCRDSVHAHRQFAELARARGARVLLLATWSPEPAWQPRLDRATSQLAARVAADVVPAGRALHAYARRRSLAAVLPDGSHPGLPATLIIAAQLHRGLTGVAPQAADVTLDFALLPPDAAIRADAPLERQRPLAPDAHARVLQADALAPLLEAAIR